ncbi:MAG: SGNH/GDSL hydrolase family protein [Akkermansiaceae bacterium]|nr:SGNH/GDSL hydrolase family protein [Akkermansiaceae bacterium]
MKQLLLRFIRACNRRFAGRTVVVIGDSHCEVFGHDYFRIKFPFTRFDVRAIHGATASGLENPNSKTRAGNYFEEAALSAAFRGTPVILMLGEVDTGFVIWYRANKYAASVDLMMETAVKNYTKLIKHVSERCSAIVISTPLPTISDDNDWGDISNQRKAVTASQVDRTALTIRFNSEIEKHCSILNVPYINLDRESIGVDGLISKALTHSDPSNHHYNPLAHAKVITPHLRRALRRYQ